MNRPPSLDFVLGARTSVVLTTGAAALSTFVWATQHTIAWPVPVIALGLCKASFAAKKRVAVWRDWRGTWDEMAGAGQSTQPGRARPAPPPPANLAAKAAQQQEPAKPAPGRPRIPRAALIVGWLLLVFWLKAHQGEDGTPALGFGALCFFGLTIWGAVAACIDVRRWLSRPASPRISDGQAAPEVSPEGAHIVAQCLPVPRNALPSGHVRDVLPAYARELLQRSSAAASPQPSPPRGSHDHGDRHEG